MGDKPVAQDLRHFNPRSPRGERLRPPAAPAPPAGFQSTLPAGGATRQADRQQQASLISIHAPRGGSDTIMGIFRIDCLHFNPRSPRGERPPNLSCIRFAPIFQSTLPAGGATKMSWAASRLKNISIHAPRGGSDKPCDQIASKEGISIHAPRGGERRVAGR